MHRIISLISRLEVSVAHRDDALQRSRATDEATSAFAHISQLLMAEWNQLSDEERQERMQRDADMPLEEKQQSIAALLALLEEEANREA